MANLSIASNPKAKDAKDFSEEMVVAAEEMDVEKSMFMIFLGFYLIFLGWTVRERT